MKLPLVLTFCAASPLFGGDASTVLWHDRPASRFYESAPLGNGRVGAMAFGGTNEARAGTHEPV